MKENNTPQQMDVAGGYSLYYEFRRNIFYGENTRPFAKQRKPIKFENLISITFPSVAATFQ